MHAWLAMSLFWAIKITNLNRIWDFDGKALSSMGHQSAD
jgi:hypothetical protein